MNGPVKRWGWVSGYVQIVEQTDKEKLKMYMRLPKKKLAQMLITANKYIDSYSTAIRKPHDPHS